MALRAHAVELVSVGFEQETVRSGYLFLNGFDSRFLEFDNVTAFHANQVIVVGGVVGELIASKTIAEVSLVGHATLGEQFERSVHCCIADPRILHAYLSEQFLNADVILRAKKRFDDDVPLIGRPQATFGHVRRKDGTEVFESRRITLNGLLRSYGT